MAASAMAACAHVLETYELLENILLHLPLRDLLLAERVSKPFRHIIKRSKTIRQVLFREGINPNTTLAYNSRPERSWLTLDSASCRPISNPLLGHAILYGYGLISLNGLLSPHHPEMRVELDTAPSWKTMLPTQPLTAFVDGVSGDCNGVWDHASGVTLGHLHKHMRNHLRNCPECQRAEAEGEEYWGFDGCDKIRQVDAGRVTGWEMRTRLGKIKASLAPITAA